MKILLCHNYYQEPGGEDQSFAVEAALLESHGHEVVLFTVHNNTIKEMSRWGVAWRTIWNGGSYNDLLALIEREHPTIMHCTNTFPLISPAAYFAARAGSVSVVQSLRNYRLLCPNGTFLRDGRVCEACLGKSVPWPAVVHGCYRESRAGSAVVAAMLGVHRFMKTWNRAVDLFYALTEFSRQKFIEGGLPPEKIRVKPNFIHPDPEPGDGRDQCAVFVGRLSQEKGIDVLLDAWSQLRDPIPLKIIGDGPFRPRVRKAAAENAQITWLGRRKPEEVATIVGAAACLVIPSICYEGLPRTIVEAFAKGTPVVASRLGSMFEVVDDGRTGLHFDPGSPADLASKVRELTADKPRQAQMRQAARREYEKKYSSETNYDMLMAIYEEAVTGKVSQHA